MCVLFFIPHAGVCAPLLKPYVLLTLLQAGEALKVLSSAVPVVGGLARFTAAALKAGDRHIQTRRVVKVSLYPGTFVLLLHDISPLLAWPAIGRFTSGLLAPTIRCLQITEMATDANECCSLARTLALRLADGLAASTIPTICNLEDNLPTVEDVDGGAGENGVQRWFGSCT